MPEINFLHLILPITWLLVGGWLTPAPSQGPPIPQREGGWWVMTMTMAGGVGGGTRNLEHIYLYAIYMYMYMSCTYHCRFVYIDCVDMYSKLSMLSEQGAQAVSSAKRPQAMRKPKWCDPKQPVRSGWYSTWDGYTHDMCILTWVKNLIASWTPFASVSDLYQTSTLQCAMLQTFEVHLRRTSCTSDHVCIGRLKMVNPNLTPEGTERCAVRVSATKKQRSHQCYSTFGLWTRFGIFDLGRYKEVRATIKETGLATVRCLTCLTWPTRRTGSIFRYAQGMWMIVGFVRTRCAKKHVVQMLASAGLVVLPRCADFQEVAVQETSNWVTNA